ncbi:MAG: TldD/PmbA family protein [Thermoplasmata archaeon]|nr:TldD/PmbA family protein [Thermoplasmata archaeon]
MTENLAAELAPRLRAAATAPWEVYAQRATRHEIHFNGDQIELVRGPLATHGYGLRLFRPAEKSIRVGFAASNQFDAGAIDRTVQRAEAAAQYASFPASKVELPGSAPSLPSLSIVDERFQADPAGTLDAFVAGLLAAFETTPRGVPSFGSIRATLAESSIANSEGLSAQFASTEAELEVAVKASGGPEGAPPGEFWVNRSARRVAEADLGVDVPTWVKLAEDMRRARAPSTGPQTVVFPADVLADIVPPVLGFRLSGPAELRQMGTTVGTAIAPPAVTVWDDGRLPWGTGTQPIDDEGTPEVRRALVENGVVSAHLYDSLHGAALGHPATGSALRGGGLGAAWYRFASGLSVSPTNLVIPPGPGGDVSELAEQVGEGIWLTQLGFPFPDPVAGTFGGEIRAAYRIHGGKIGEPLRGGTVGGPVLGPTLEGTLLGGVRAIGSRATLVGSFHAPPLLVDGVGVAGGP